MNIDEQTIRLIYDVLVTYRWKAEHRRTDEDNFKARDALIAVEKYIQQINKETK
jgi:hypothetical protein